MVPRSSPRMTSQADTLLNQSIYSLPAHSENFILRKGIAKYSGGAKVVPLFQEMPLVSSSRIALTIPAVESSLISYIILTLFLLAVIWIIEKKIWDSWSDKPKEKSNTPSN